MKRNHKGAVLRIRHKDQASLDPVRRSGSELHRKTLALPRGEGSRKRQPGNAEAGPANRGLADGYAAGADVRNRPDLRAGATHDSAHREASWGDGKLR